MACFSVRAQKGGPRWPVLFLCIMNRRQPLTTLLGQVEAEYKRASALYGNFSSTHEGYAVLKEEVDELWDGIKKNDSKRLLKEEAIQIAAMAIRFCTDICERN